MALSVTDFQALVRTSIENARARRDELVALPADASANERIDRFDEIAASWDGPLGRGEVYSAAHPDVAMREAGEKATQDISSFATELSLDRAVFESLASIDPAELEGDHRKRLHEHAMRDFRRSGVDRDEETRERVRKLQDELVEIGLNFDRNIVEGGIEFTIEEGASGLAGLPEDFIASHPPAEDGSITLSSDAPDFVPFMLYSERGDLREPFFAKYQDRSYPVNEPILAQLMQKRHELATLLGYDHYAHYVTEVLMVRSADRAREFVDEVVRRARPRAEVEYQELLAAKSAHEGKQATAVQEWEWSYWVEVVKRERFGFDSQAMRPYFNYDAVEDGICRLSEQLYGVEIVRVESEEAWHEDVRSFEIREGGECIARFYLDMFPRDGKYKHAAMFDIVHGQAGRRIPEAALFCNFPVDSSGKPSLMLHEQVTTYFHEFGHLLHGLFAGKQRFSSFSGISCEWDFVEVPSQLYEEWAWDYDVLTTFAKHHETGEVIPRELVDGLRAAEEYGKALGVLRQMTLARLSLACYDRDPNGLDVYALLKETKERTTILPALDSHMPCSFGHLNGYSAIYYTYMWSLVISKDFWGAFEANPMDRAKAKGYREAVLEAGGSQDASEMAKQFLGREYEFDAWERWLAS